MEPRPLPMGENKKVIGLMKDELGGKIIGSTQRRTFRNISQFAVNLPGLKELACHCITAFPDK